ncbi:MAG: SOS response-associated peptidase family protein [Desulfuromonadales bacterium]
MCGRFVLEHSPEQLMKVYRLSSVPDLSPRYNIAPSQQIAVVRQQNGGDRELTSLQWGLIRIMSLNSCNHRRKKHEVDL